MSSLIWSEYIVYQGIVLVCVRGGEVRDNDAVETRHPATCNWSRKTNTTECFLQIIISF